MPKLTGRSYDVSTSPSAADQPDAESGDRLKRPAVAVVVGIELEVVDDLRRDPAGADLVARKRRAVDDDDVEAGLAQRPRARRSGRAAADDHDVAGDPRFGRSEFQPLTRVQGMALLLPRANTTWNSCIEPVVNAACEPAR